MVNAATGDVKTPPVLVPHHDDQTAHASALRICLASRRSCRLRWHRVPLKTVLVKSFLGLWNPSSGSFLILERMATSKVGCRVRLRCYSFLHRRRNYRRGSYGMY